MSLWSFKGTGYEKVHHRLYECCSAWRCQTITTSLDSHSPAAIQHIKERFETNGRIAERICQISAPRVLQKAAWFQIGKTIERDGTKNTIAVHAANFVIANTAN